MQSHVSIPLLWMCMCGLCRLFWNIGIGLKLYKCTGSILNSRTCFCDAFRDRIVRTRICLIRGIRINHVETCISYDGHIDHITIPHPCHALIFSA